jgi:hypothetical protein
MQTCPHCGFVNINERTTCKQCHQSFTVIPPGGLPIAQSAATPAEPAPAPVPTPAATGPTAVLPKKTALWLKIAGGLGAFVVGCCVLLIIGLMNPSHSDTEATEPTAAPRATEVDPPMPSPTTVPTDTPRPTRTPAPTNTPEPTRTPRPTPTEAPAQSFTSAEQQYIAVVQKQTTAIGQALGKIGDLAQAFDGSDEWTLAMAAQIVTIQIAHDELTKLDPPARFSDFHTMLLGATADCDQAMDKLTSGIDRNRTADIETATVLMGTCAAKTQPALTELRRLTQP